MSDLQNSNGGKQTKGTAKSSKQEIPNFAFPKDVQKNSEKDLQKALEDDNYEQAFRALLNYSVADVLISGDAYNNLYHLCDSLNNRFPDDYKILLQLLQAQLLMNQYQGDRWEADRRNLPLDSYPDNIAEWSGEQVNNRINQFAEESLMQLSAVKDRSLSDLKSIIKMERYAETMTESDFVVLQYLTLLNQFARSGAKRIPFAGAETEPLKPAEKSAELMDSLIATEMNELYASGDSQRLQLVSVMINNTYNKAGVIDRKLINALKETPYCALALARFIEAQERDNTVDEELIMEDSESVEANNEIQHLNKINRLIAEGEEYMNKYSAAPYIKDLRRVLANLSRSRCSIRLNNRFIPGEDISVDINYTNIPALYLHIRKVTYRAGDLVTMFEKPDVKKWLSTAKKVRTVKVDVKANDKGSGKLSMQLDGLDAGMYMIVPSLDANKIVLPGENAQDVDNRWSSFIVSDLSLIYASTGYDTYGRIYAVDSRNQKPVPGVELQIVRGWGKRETVKAVTNADGYYELPNITGNGNNIRVYAIKNGSYASVNGYMDYQQYHTPREVTIDLVSDLPIYRPGDTVRFAGVVAGLIGKEQHPVGEMPVKVELLNANWEVVDSLDLVSDKPFGRFSGEFNLPAEGLLGTWRIRVNSERKFVELPGKDISSYPATTALCNIKVEEYKEPSFMVNLKAQTASVTAGEPVIIKGEALTYSGMPVTDAAVSYEIHLLSWWRMSSYMTFNGTAVTDKDGKFTITLETGALKGTEFDNRRYTIVATVTDGAGESQQSNAADFVVGKTSDLTVDMSDRINLSQTERPVKVTYTRDGEPVDVTIAYHIYDEAGKEVKAGSFVSPDFDVAKLNLPSGKYKFTFEVAEGNADSVTDSKPVEKKVILFRDSDTMPPVQTPLWLPSTRYIVPTGKSVAVKVGSSFTDSYILAIIQNSGSRDGEYRWLKVNGEIAELNLLAINDTTRTEITFIGMHNDECQSETVTIIPQIQTERLKIETVTFRDNIEPGAPEKWSFRFIYEGKEMANIPVMAVMNNAALDALAPYRWSFGLDNMVSYYIPGSLRFPRKSFISTSASSRYNYGGSNIITPDWQLYGASFDYYGRYRYDEVVPMMAVVDQSSAAIEEDGVALNSSIRVRGTMKMAASYAAKNEMADVEEAVTADSEHEPKHEDKLAAGIGANGDQLADGGSGDNGASEEMSFRSMECPLAFFMPDLVTDAEGVAHVDYQVPDYNGKWNFYLMGYTPELKLSTLSLSATAARKVMVRLNAPRFLRTGDHANIAATLYNNSDEALMIGGGLEIIDPVTGTVIAKRAFDKESVAAKGNRVVNFGLDVPDNVEVVTLRGYAECDGSRDGEQTPLVILPASQPVIDATTFYAAPDVSEINLEVPRTKEGGTVTLEYIDNPIWECVKALPGMLDGSDYNALSLVRNLFGVAVSKGIFGQYPDLLTGLQKMDSTDNGRESELISALEKNANLKTVVLGNTPWVQNGIAETMRMQSLLKFADVKTVDDEINRTIELLKRLQTDEGGWPWCAGFKASDYITGRVLLHISMLGNMGYLPEGCTDMIAKAVKFCDNSITKYYNECQKNKIKPSEMYMLDYWYLRSMYPEIKWSSTLEKTRKIALAGARKWESLSIYHKAIAAWVLFKNDEQETAKTILSSLAQFATSTPEKGMWFDTLDSRFGSWNKLITTTQVLESWDMIDPAAPEVAKLRQWLVLSKLTEDWGANPYTAEIIATVITSGKADNVVIKRKPQMKLNGETVSIPEASMVAGNFTYTLPLLKGKKNTLTIERESGTPAFGGLITQYMEKVTDVKAAKVDELKIEKAVYVVNPETGAVEKSNKIKVGDKVQVTLTITSGRDMDYVAVIDERSSCLEPLDQTSGYELVGSTPAYKEIRNSRTSFFLPYLPKGVTVLSYECTVSQSGIYALGMASAQSQYEPAFTAHTAGTTLTVSE